MKTDMYNKFCAQLYGLKFNVFHEPLKRKLIFHQSIEEKKKTFKLITYVCNISAVNSDSLLDIFVEKLVDLVTMKKLRTLQKQNTTIKY